MISGRLNLCACAALAVIGAAWCSRSAHAPGGAAAPVTYDSVEDCLNGAAVVSLGGRWGVVGDDGQTIVPVEYDDAWFLTDDAIAAFSGEDCEIFSPDSRRIGMIAGGRNLSPGQLLAAYEDACGRWYAQWDAVVDGYERLCGMAGGPAAAGAVQACADSLAAAARAVDGGRLTEGQARRVDEACRRALR